MKLDYVIIGAGTAGCVLAHRLTEDPSVRVLVIEAGGPYPRALNTPLSSMHQIPSFAWRYNTVPQRGLFGRKIFVPFGKLLGGTSSINAMIYTRGNRLDYDHWAELGNPGWSYADVLPDYKRSENQQRGACDYHGVGGWVDVSDPRHLAPFSHAFIEACGANGIPHNPDFNGPRQHGAGFFQVLQRRGRRGRPGVTYLRAATSRPNLQILTDATVLELLFDRQRATGVRFSQAGAVEIAHADREILLCAGTFHSPKLLMLSGIGPAAALGDAGIPVRLDRPGVGERLQDHLRLPVLYESLRPPPAFLPTSLPLLARIAPQYAAYLLARRGVFASNGCEAGAFVNPSQPDAPPTLQFTTHWLGSAGWCVDFEPCLIDCKSQGRVMLNGKDPTNPIAPPRIDPAYLSVQADVDRLVDGIKLARQLARAAVFKHTFPLAAEYLPGADVQSQGDLRRYVRAHVDTCYHPAGTCKMGPAEDPMAVVDADLRLHGIEGLRIVDASIMPTLIRGNTCSTAIMIAERAADKIQRGNA